MSKSNNTEENIIWLIDSFIKSNDQKMYKEEFVKDILTLISNHKASLIKEVEEFMENYHFFEKWQPVDSEEEKGIQIGITRGEKLLKKNLQSFLNNLQVK